MLILSPQGRGEYTPLKCGPQVWVPSPEKTGWGRGERKRNSSEVTPDRHTSAKWSRAKCGESCWEHGPAGHDDKGTFPLWPSSLNPQAQANNEKNIRQASRGTVCHPCPALLQTVRVVQTRKVWETLQAKSSWRRREDYLSREVRTGPGAAGGREVKPEETWINANNNVLIWYASVVSLIVTNVPKDVSNRTHWMWGI